MVQVEYTEYLKHLGYGAYKYRHQYGFTNHTTQVFSNGILIAKVVRKDDNTFLFYCGLIDMGNPVFILGDTGTGKTTSLENLDPKECILIKVVNKPLSFSAKGWTKLTKENPEGSVVISDNPDTICRVISNTKRKIIIIDDFQYIMANAFMNGVDRTYSGGEAFQRFNVIAKDVYNIMHTALNADDEKIIYFLSHTEESPTGKIKVKTIGKLLDEKVVLEGLCTIVLRSIVTNGVYEFSTQNNGNDTCKSPKGMFEKERIPNDLKLVTETINQFYGFN